MFVSLLVACFYSSKGSIEYTDFTVGKQTHSQGEARKPGLQHHMGLDAINPDFVACKQQRCRSVCVYAQYDQPLC